MKKFMLICILCGVLLTGCSEKSGSVNNETTPTDTTVTTAETTETSVTTEDLQVSDTTVSVIATDAAEVATTVSGEKKIESVKTTEEKAGTTAPRGNEETTEPRTTTTKKATTEAPVTTTKATTTVAPVSSKTLNSAFKAELIEYIKDYCGIVGYTYSEAYSDWECTPTPDNTSWDIPVRTADCTTNDKIKELVKNSVSFLKRSGYDNLVVCLYFEKDSQANGEWRIYVLF